MTDYISREALLRYLNDIWLSATPTDLMPDDDRQLAIVRCMGLNDAMDAVKSIPAADVRPMSEIEKIIESLQEQADIYNARAKELLVEEDGWVSQYTWAVSLRETYRRIIKTLDDLIS